MRGFRDVLTDAQQTHTAVGHFNVADLVLVKAVFAAARDLGVAALVGASEGERDFFGTRQLACVVRSLREDNECSVFLNADHTHSLSKAIEATRAGFDSVVFDLSNLPIEENARQTKDAVGLLKDINPGLIVEGEIGDIGSGSEIHEHVAESAKILTTVEEASQFVQFTGVDVLAPAVGNLHGMSHRMAHRAERKRLDIERIAQIKSATGVFLTLHGGSGTDDGDLSKAIIAGINIVHINTEIRLAWRSGLDKTLSTHPSEIVPYKLLPEVVDRVKRAVAARLTLFNRVA